jgi:NAD(P)-dependent dehydrogenase (short-subunit alcohol dehydrogenase family)
VTALRFDGLVAVVTGAGRGLGREFACALADRGAAVVVNDIGSSTDSRRYATGPGESADPASEVAEAIVASGGRAVANCASVADPDGAASIVDAALEAFGRIDIVINNAGVVITNAFDALTVAELQACFDVHVKGAFLVSQQAWRPMVAQGGGRILNVCSVDGVVLGNVGHVAYDAAKGGLAGLTRGMAIEGAPHGIVVNGLLPGAYTRGQKSVDPALTPAAVIDMRPELVAPSACWLVHRDCDVTGSFFASSAGRIGRVFTGVAEGFQDDPDRFSPERIRDRRDQVVGFEPYVVPATTQEFNTFRIDLFNRMTNGRGASA